MWPAFSFHGRWRPRIALLAALFGCIVTACLYVIVSKTTGATAAAPGVIQIKLSVDPATLQLSGACRIVAIHGLGSLDGDYILADEPTVGHERWHGVSMSIQNLVLSYLAEEGVWSIGAEDWNRAFLNGDPGIPPAQSSQWQIYNTNSSVFEDVGGVVSISCPPCTVVALSILANDLGACNGPYRLEAANNDAGIFAWSHVSDERCAMIHDKSGNSIVQMVRAPSTAVAPDALVSQKKWAQMVRENNSPLQSMGDTPSAVCTSAGHTTRLVFDLMTSPTFLPPAESQTTSVKLVSQQDASIISSANSNINIRVSRAAAAAAAAGMRQRDGIDVRSRASAHLDDDTTDGPGLSDWPVKITVDGAVVNISLENASTRGFPVALEGWEGTIVFEVCVFEAWAEGDPGENQSFVDPHVCVAEGVLILELYSAETQVVQRRSSREMVLPSSPVPGGLLDEGLGSTGGTTRVAFLISLDAVDGYQLSTLHLMKHLPSNFQASAVDLTCALGDLPVKDVFMEHGLEVFRLCIELPKEAWDMVQSQGVSVQSHFYSVLEGVPTWEDAISGRPYVEQALGELHQHLTNFDVIVMSNGAKDDAAFLLQIARLAGVGIRQVNLGSIVGGYMSPLYSGATSLVGPSHYVAHSPAVNRNAGKAGGLPVKVCHPVMDGARVLSAAGCHHATNATGALVASDSRLRQAGGGTHDDAWTSSGEEDVNDDRGSRVGDDDYRYVPPAARFIMVAKMEAYKTPGMFVRAMAILQRRWAAAVGVVEGDTRQQQQQQQQQRSRPEGVMVGKGPLRGHMEGLARDLNASVRFAGFLSIDAVPCEVQQATALVVPSISLETFGMVGPEAMILGVPLVTFGYGGTGELVRHMENGILVAEPTPRALADALELLASDTALRDRLGAQARLDALEALSLEDMVACHAEEFLALKRVPTPRWL